MPSLGPKMRSQRDMDIKQRLATATTQCCLRTKTARSVFKKLELHLPSLRRLLKRCKGGKYNKEDLIY